MFKNQNIINQNISNQNINYNRKYLKYKQKYYELKYEYNLIGGGAKSGFKYEEFKIKLQSLDRTVIKHNLTSYYQIKIDQLTLILNQKLEKITNEIDNDKINRRNLITTIRNSMNPEQEIQCTSFLTNKQMILPEICNEYEINEGYIKVIKEDTKSMDEYINNSKAVQEIRSIILVYNNTQNAIRNLTNESINTYITNITNFCDSNVSPPFDEYKEELCEYLLLVLQGTKKIQSPPFNIIITGSPGVGKSHLAIQISQLLGLTYLLPYGTLINLKKPDVIGQYIGQTAPKTYNLLQNGLGKIIFIDEAYSFAGEKTSNGYDQFGLEFINALTDFMTEHKGLIGIIVAGYQKEMTTQFIDTNSGLKRRFGTNLNIVRYTLSQIFDTYNKISKDNKLQEDIIDYSKKITGYDYTEQSNEIVFVNRLLYTFINLFYLSKPDDNNVIFNFNFKNIDNSLHSLDKIDNKYIYKIYLAILLENIGIKNGDLFNNQISDIIEYISICKTVFAITNKPILDAIVSIFTSYIEYKSQLKINKDFNIEYKNESNKVIFDFTFNLKMHDSKILDNNLLTAIESNSIESNSIEYKVFLIKHIEVLIKRSELNSDYILFTLVELYKSEYNILIDKDL